MVVTMAGPAHCYHQLGTGVNSSGSFCGRSMDPGFHQGPFLHFMGGFCQVYHMILTTTWWIFWV